MSRYSFFVFGKNAGKMFGVAGIATGRGENRADDNLL
jgi:hypothetical protein